MDLEIEQEGVGQVEFLLEIPENLKRFLVPDTVTVCIRGNGFVALTQEFRDEQFSAWYSIFDIFQGPVILKARGAIAVLELRTALRNTIEGTWEMQPAGSLEENHFQMGFTPHVATRAIFPAPGIYETFDIHFTLSFLDKLGIDYAMLARFIEKVQRDDPAELTRHSFECTPLMRDCIHRILYNGYTPAGKKRLLRNAVTAYLLDALEESGGREKTMHVLTKYHIDKIYAAREMMIGQFPEPVLIATICETVGITEAALNFGFRQVFGMKPNQYYQHLRFAKAKEMLRDGHTVDAVALTLQYTSASYFITMFKARFGCTPGMFQKRKY